MATFYNGGLIKAHDPRFGINHKYIADKLTKDNWKKKMNLIHLSIIFYQFVLNSNSNTKVQ